MNALSVRYYLAPDAWIDHSKTKVGYEISFTRQFYKYTAQRSSAEITASKIPAAAETS